MIFVKILRKILRKIQFKLRICGWSFNRKFKKTTTISTKQGIFTVTCEINDPISELLYVNREFELDLMSNVVKFLQKEGKLFASQKGTVLDIGANIGVTSIGMLHNGWFENAIAIEAEPNNCALLEKNIIQNKLSDKIEVLPYAVSDNKKIIEFELSQNNFGGHAVRMSFNKQAHDLTANELYNESSRQVIKINSDKIDHLLKNICKNFQQNIALIWIDVEGHEGYVFQGAKELLSNDIPVVAEIYPYLILRSGMDLNTFSDIVCGIWSSFYVMRKWAYNTGTFVKYPIVMFNFFLQEELAKNNQLDNVIFTK